LEGARTKYNIIIFIASIQHNKKRRSTLLTIWV
jgi:hypothetical protein